MLFMVKTTLNMFARVPHRAVFGTTGVIDRPVGYNGSAPRENILGITGYKEAGFRERFKLRLNRGILPWKRMKKHEGLPPWP